MKLRPLFPLTWLLLIATVAVTAQENQPPVLDPIGPKSTTEGKRLTFEVSAQDPDGTTPSIWSFEHDSLPPMGSFNDNGDGTGTFDWWPGYSTAGTYYVTFWASDGELDSDPELVRIDVAEHVPYDPGYRDTVELVVTIQPDEGSSQFNVELELYVFNDSTIIGATAGFSWDNPNLQLDNAEATDLTSSGFDAGPVFYRGNNIDSSNFYRQVRFMGSILFSAPGVPPATERQHWATYYFTLSEWSAVDSIVIDTEMVPPSDSLLFTVKDTTELRQQVAFVPEWTGKLVIKDVSDVRVVDGGGLPETFSLGQNYPNPFNPNTQINFEIPVRSRVTLTVYNLLGQKVATLVDKEMPAGRYIADWNSASDGGTIVASGVYIYKLEAGDFIETKKMMLLK